MAYQQIESERQQRMNPLFKPLELPSGLSKELDLERELIHPYVLAIYRRGDEKRIEIEIPPSDGKGS